MILTIIIFLAVLDTLIGNRILPSKVGVISEVVGTDTFYKVYKWNRIFFIPIKMWVGDGDYERELDCFDFSRSDGTYFRTEKSAMRCAKEFANINTVPKSKTAEIWNSRTKEPKEYILTQLGEAIRDDNGKQK